MEKLLIIGGVAAGATAAARARRISPSAEITILESGPDISFANCGLPYYIGGDIQNRSSLILQSPESFWNQYQVKVHTYTSAESIDTKEKVVTAKNTQTGKIAKFEYTKLILAQGGRPITPNLPGTNLEHVFTLWTLEDMDKIDSYIKNHKPQSAVIAGGGFIGLEMAEALAKRGLNVHVVEKLPHVMSLMDAEIAGFIEEEMTSYNVSLYKNTGVAKIDEGHVYLDNGKSIQSDMVLLSIGVKPTLQLAKDANLSIGSSGGLLVNEFLQSSDPSIYAAGDMVEIEHRVHHAKVRIPLAGPANRQGRIAADNALGKPHKYTGALGTSIVRVFEAVAGITGLSLKAARSAGIDADAVTIHKEHHTSYYPGSTPVTVRIVYDKKTGRVLGGQTAGYAGADRRLDILATAAYQGMTIHDFADLDLAYSPPLGTANDPVNIVAFVAENRQTGYSKSLVAEEIDTYIKLNKPFIIDIRDKFAFEKSHIIGANHIPLEFIRKQIAQIPTTQPLLIYCDTGKRSHQALRLLTGLRGGEIVNVSGGIKSLVRHAQASGFSTFKLKAIPIAKKSLQQHSSPTDADKSLTYDVAIDPSPEKKIDTNNLAPLIIDVRTPNEFAGGAFPGAINIPLDTLPLKMEELGEKNRDITLYCASGGRSSYAVQFLRKAGFSNLTNGGGLMDMLESMV